MTSSLFQLIYIKFVTNKLIKKKKMYFLLLKMLKSSRFIIPSCNIYLLDSAKRKIFTNSTIFLNFNLLKSNLTIYYLFFINMGDYTFRDRPQTIIVLRKQMYKYLINIIKCTMYIINMFNVSQN